MGSLNIAPLYETLRKETGVSEKYSSEQHRNDFYRNIKIPLRPKKQSLPIFGFNETNAAHPNLPDYLKNNPLVKSKGDTVMYFRSIDESATDSATKKEYKFIVEDKNGDNSKDSKEGDIQEGYVIEKDPDGKEVVRKLEKEELAKVYKEMEQASKLKDKENPYVFQEMRSH